MIAELAGQNELVEDTAGSYPAWLYAVVGTLVLVMILTALTYKCKGRCLRGSARRRGGGGNSRAAAEAPGMQMVSVTTTGGGDDALRGVVPSALLLRRDEEPMDVDTPPEAETKVTALRQTLRGRWFQRFCADAKTEGMSNFSLDRPGALQQRGGYGDGLPGTAASGWDRQGAMSCVHRHKGDDTRIQ